MDRRNLTIGGIEVPADSIPVMNGAGIAKNITDVEKLLKNPDMPIIVLGSITVEERMGNPGNTLYIEPEDKFTVNSLGLNNSGLAKYRETLREILDAVHEAGKKLVVSVASVNNTDDIIKLFELCHEVGVDGIELNEGCPNVWKAGTQKEIVSFNDEMLDGELFRLIRYFGVPKLSEIPVWLKISPLVLRHTEMRVLKVGDGIDLPMKLQTILIKKQAQILNAHRKFIRAVVSTNTVPNVRVVDEISNPVLGPNPNNPDATGGLAGKIIHDVSVVQAQLLRESLISQIDLIGVGGIYTGKDMEDFMNVGARAVQIVSAYLRNHDASVFSKVAEEFLFSSNVEA